MTTSTFARLLLTAGLALGLATPVFAQSPAGQRGTLLVHGNYCGPGNRAPLPPIDALDAACARHDACTPRSGLASAVCNARLYQEANAIAHDPRQPADLQAAAGFVAFGASLLPSAPAHAMAPVPRRVRHLHSVYAPLPVPADEVDQDDED